MKKIFRVIVIGFGLATAGTVMIVVPAAAALAALDNSH
jgi:hypothetical protein